jgi:GH15 family glucan-1,4-alpha-glucosidase
MAWVAMDPMIKEVEEFGCPGHLDRWREVRDEIHREVCTRGFDSELNSFVQYYGSKKVDASLLMLPLVGFLPATDPRMRGTIAAIEKQLMHDGFLYRYPTRRGVDGLPPGEGVFLACTCWFADNLALLGRREEAVKVLERLLALRNDVGLMSEQYDPKTGRMLGNFPQAFSHIALINTIRNLAQDGTLRGSRRGG